MLDRAVLKIAKVQHKSSQGYYKVDDVEFRNESDEEKMINGRDENS